jgi:phosphoglycerate dehydrogenase-like enzyme
MKIVVGDSNLGPHRHRFEAGLPATAKVSWYRSWESSGLIDDLSDADVYVGSRFTAEMAAAAPRLRLLHLGGAGTDKADFAALAAEVQVCNTFNHEQSIAEYVTAAAVMLRRGFLIQDRELRQGNWATSVYDAALPQSRSLRGARIGFVGYGHIGRRSWELLRPFGTDAVAVTGRGGVDAGAEGLRWSGDTGRLDELMAESDVVVVSAPLNDRTEGMIGAAQLAALGADGVLINVGRGPLVQETALYEALSAGTIAAAAIDVWYRYPGPDGRADPADRPFAQLPNVLMTPHSSGVTDDTFRGRADDIAANISRLQRDEPLHNVIAR